MTIRYPGTKCEIHVPKIQILVKFQNINSHHESHSYVIGFTWIGQDN